VEIQNWSVLGIKWNNQNAIMCQRHERTLLIFENTEIEHLPREVSHAYEFRVLKEQMFATGPEGSPERFWYKVTTKHERPLTGLFMLNEDEAKELSRDNIVELLDNQNEVIKSGAEKTEVTPGSVSAE